MPIYSESLICMHNYDRNNNNNYTLRNCTEYISDDWLGIFVVALSC